LTVTAAPPGLFAADVSPETLRRSTLAHLGAGAEVNLEQSLRLGDRLSGHLVFGHVDGIGRLVGLRSEGASYLYEFEAPPSVSRYLVEKGSIAVDGISLTVFGCEDDRFSVAVIPHTARVTTLGKLAPGDAVNLESDMIARYVEKLASAYRA
jgi:riboflavin synthase